MDLQEIDQFEVQSHVFERQHLQKVYDWWEVKFAIDGVPREMVIVLQKHVDDRGLEPYTEPFENFIKAQALSAPVELKHG